MINVLPLILFVSKLRYSDKKYYVLLRIYNFDYDLWRFNKMKFNEKYELDFYSSPLDAANSNLLGIL